MSTTQLPHGLPQELPNGVAREPPQVDELLEQLDDGVELPRRERIINPLTWGLLIALTLVGTFGLGAWTHRSFGGKVTAAAGHTGGGASGATPAGAAAAASGGAARGQFGAGAGGAGASGGTPTSAATATTTAASGQTIGKIKLIDGANLYLVDAQGVITKVHTAAETALQVSKPGTMTDFAVGDTVVVVGEAGADGTVAATAVQGTGTAGRPRTAS